MWLYGFKKKIFNTPSIFPHAHVCFALLSTYSYYIPTLHIYIMVCHEQLNIIKTVVPSTVAAGCLTNKLLFYFMICLLLIHNCSLWGGTFGRENFRKFSLLQSFATLKKLCCCNWETGKKYSGYKKYLLPKIEIKLKCNSYFYFRQKLEPTMTTWSLYMLAIWMLLTWFYWKSTYVPSIQKFQIWRNHKSSEPIQTHFLRK